ncbi:MAG: diaminopimelate epimerase [Clostridia bacterium]
MQFTKVQGLGNDFILVDARTGKQPDFNAIAPRICNRHTGIGADGILLVLCSDVADIRMRIINSDGSEAEMCGNGIRAFSKYVYERDILQKEIFTVETLAGIMRPALTIQGGCVQNVTVDMGEPFLDCQEIPVVGQGRCIDRILTVDGHTVRYTTVLVGVPHTVVFVDDLAQPGLMELGNAIEHADVFPRRTNVNFVHVLDDHNVEVRTWERGCGPTLACGTGCCSVAVCCVLNGKTERRVAVHIALGTLQIEWAEDHHVYMTGPAELVFTGDILI